MNKACDVLNNIFTDDTREEDKDDQDEGDTKAKEQEIKYPLRLHRK